MSTNVSGFSADTLPDSEYADDTWSSRTSSAPQHNDQHQAAFRTG